MMSQQIANVPTSACSITNVGTSACSITKYIYDLKIVDKLAKRYASYIGETNIDDFKQTIYCMLLEIPEQKLQSLYEKNQLVYYVIAITRNQAVNYRSTFNQQYNDDKLIFIDDYSLTGSSDNHIDDF